MRVVDVSFFYDDFVKTEEELLQLHYTTVGWAEALRHKAVDVIVVKRFYKDASFVKNGVQYYFIKDGFGGTLKLWQLPFSFLKAITKLNADIIQLHTFPFSIPSFVLRLLSNKQTAIVVQNHGGSVAKGMQATLNKTLSHFADAFFFTSAIQANDWFKSERLRKKAMSVMESCTVFDVETMDKDRSYVYHDRQKARLLSNIRGNPVFLWVGNLDENKDPLTVLDGFEILFEKYTDATLYMIFGNEKLLPQVKQKIASSKLLSNRVHLIGKIPHHQLPEYYNSANYFVLGSHYEGSGFALSEALSFGCISIVTDIPSFRIMTNDGTLGTLWQTGNGKSFADAVDYTMQKSITDEANACINFFVNNLSFDAIANVAIDHYKAIIEKKNKR